MAFNSSSLSGSTAVPTLRSIREELMRGSTEWELLTSSQMQQQLAAQLRAVEDDIVSIGSNEALSSSILTGSTTKSNGGKRLQFSNAHQQPPAGVGASLERLLTEAQYESISNSRLVSRGASKIGSPSIATPIDFTYISCMRLSSPGTQSRAGETVATAHSPRAAALLPVGRAPPKPSRQHRRGASRKPVAPSTAAGRYAVPTSASMHPQLLRNLSDRKKYNFARGLTLAQISKRSKSDPNLPDNTNAALYEDDNEDYDDGNAGFDDDAEVDEDAAQMFAKFAAESSCNPLLALTNNGGEDVDQADWLWDWTAWRNHFEMSYALERIEEMEAASAKQRKRIYGIVLLSNIAVLFLGFVIGRSIAKSSGSLVRSISS